MSPETFHGRFRAPREGMSMTMITIRKELHRDVDAREALLDLSLGNERFENQTRNPSRREFG